MDDSAQGRSPGAQPGASGERRALLGDGRTAVLVADDGTIDFACLPRFDSPAVLCRALDPARGGSLLLRPGHGRATGRRYEDGAILVTTLQAAGGSARVTDFMPVDDLSPGARAGGSPAVCRLVEGLAGEVAIEVSFHPTFDFARRAAELEAEDGGVLARCGEERLALRAPVPLALHGGAARGRVLVRAGERRWITLGHGEAPGPAEAERALGRTRAAWARWTARCAYDGPQADAVLRSAVTLKLLTFRETGALVAAPTTSFPEWPGGVRNWDYRYTWPRDAALAQRALLLLGYHDEAMAYWEFIERLGIAEGRPLLPAYAVDGGAVPREEALEHLAGALGSRPVRIGNAAASQVQLDVGGYVMDAAELCQDRMRTPHASLMPTLATIADQVARRWREPDQGIWEIRGPPRRHVHSQAMCWVALDRALRLARRGVLRGDTRRWAGAAAELRREVLERGFDAGAGAFTAFPGSGALDASVLRLPALGLVDARDPRFAGTIERVRERLGVDGLLRRYDEPDGLPGNEGAFVAATFWLADALAASGRLDEAESTFERVLRGGNDLGLLAEELEPASGAPLGNFPQALSHLALIHSALRIAEARRARAEPART